MQKNTIDIITMGCSKNLVDSEKLMRQLELNGFKVTHDSEHPKGEIAVINTCGFIGDAKQESIDMILEFCQAKEEGRLKKLFVMGCLSERYLKELEEEIPQVDKYYGKFNWAELVTDLGKTIRTDKLLERDLTTPSHYAYLKISEGCDRQCSYCAIPIITGKHVSRPMEEILEETRMLVARGVKEFQVIAQELTYYGVDLYHRQMLPELVERMADIPGVEWIRLHYAYPANFPTDLLRVMRERDNVCKYMDIALQHISDNMLQRMRRHVTRQETYELIERFRKEVPGRWSRKFSRQACRLLAVSLAASFCKEKPDCSWKLMRLMAALTESLLKAFSEMLAVRFLMSMCCGLNTPGVSGTEATS